MAGNRKLLITAYDKKQAGRLVVDLLLSKEDKDRFNENQLSQETEPRFCLIS